MEKIEGCELATSGDFVGKPGSLLQKKFGQEYLLKALWREIKSRIATKLDQTKKNREVIKRYTYMKVKVSEPELCVQSS